MRTSLPVRVPMTVTYRRGLDVREIPVVEELEPIGYLRIFRRANGQLLHFASWDVLSVDGAAQ